MILRVCTLHYCLSAEWEKVWSQLLHLQPFFWLLAHILTIFDKKYSNLTCCDKRESYLFNCFATKQSMFRYAKIVRLASVTPTLASSGSKWLSQALAGSLWLFLAVSLSLSGSLWLPLWLPLALISTLWLTLALSDSLLFSNFAYTVLDQLSGPLLGSQRRCHADALSPALFICILFSQYKIF